MRIPENAYLRPDLGSLVRQLTGYLRDLAQQVNQLSEGQMVARYNAATAAPTTGNWAQGDFIANAEPAELGAVGSMYVIRGWICTASGEPGTWVECRYLTGS